MSRTGAAGALATLKRPNPDAAEGEQLKRSKKGKKKSSGAAPAPAPAAANDALRVSPEDYVRLIPQPKKSALQDDGWRPVQLARIDKSTTKLQLSDDHLTATGWKGFKTVRATHGVHEGTWYCEVTVAHLGESGHCRIGWCTKKSDLQAPVGFDKFGFSYRDLEGSKVHKALREPYGEQYGEGDVIGLLIHQPPGGKPLEKQEDKELVRFKGAYYYIDEPAPEPHVLPGSFVMFTKNGVPQGSLSGFPPGTAYGDILEGTYYPAAALYTLPNQVVGASVSFNFGPDFQFGPPAIDGYPEAQSLHILAGEPPPPASINATHESSGMQPDHP